MRFGEELFADADFSTEFEAFPVIGSVKGTLDLLETELADGEVSGSGFVFVFPYDGSIDPKEAEGKRVQHPETGSTLLVVRVNRLSAGLYRAFLSGL